MTTMRAWIRLPSGLHLDLLNPDPKAWTDTDLFKRLSRTPRWGGESRFAQSLSVAQHSLTVLALVEQMAQAPLSGRVKLREGMHDGEEGLIGFDLLSPIKPFLGEPFALLSSRMFDAIAERYALPEWTPEEYARHKRADLIAAASEAFHVVGWTEDEIRNVLQITHPILTVDPLAAIYGCTPWEPWMPEVAAQRFGDKMAALIAQAEAEEIPA